MTTHQMSRLAIVRDLLEFAKPLDQIRSQLAIFGWDYEGEELELRKQHLSSVLRRYLANALSDLDVVDWANQIEGREDIKFENGFADRVEKVLYELANPELTQRLNRELAQSFLDFLSDRDTSG